MYTMPCTTYNVSVRCRCPMSLLQTSYKLQDYELRDAATKMISHPISNMSQLAWSASHWFVFSSHLIASCGWSVSYESVSNYAGHESDFHFSFSILLKVENASAKQDIFNWITLQSLCVHCSYWHRLRHFKSQVVTSHFISKALVSWSYWLSCADSTLSWWQRLRHFKSLHFEGPCWLVILAWLCRLNLRLMVKKQAAEKR